MATKKTKNKANRKRSKAGGAKKAAEKPKLADQAKGAARKSRSAASVRSIGGRGETKRTRSRRKRAKRQDPNVETVPMRAKQPRSSVRSGDLQGLSTRAKAGFESVSELVDEGQIAEAGVISGVENAALADKGPVRTKEPLEDDVPEEYENQGEP